MDGDASHDLTASLAQKHSNASTSAHLPASSSSSSASFQNNTSTPHDGTRETEGREDKNVEKKLTKDERSDLALSREEEEETVPSYEEVTHQCSDNRDVAQKENKEKEEELAEPDVSSGAKSYSDIVKRLAKQAAQTSSSLPTSSDNKQPSFKVLRSSKPLEPSSVNNNSKNGGIEKGGEGASRPFSHERGGHSSNLSPYAIYVGGLPEPVNEGDLSRVFSVYGKVTSVDIARGRKYAFIRFDNVASMQSALDHAIPVELNGHSLQAEEKTHKYPPNRNDSSRRREREKERDGSNTNKGTEKKFMEKSSGEKSPKGKNGDLVHKQQKGHHQQMKKEGEIFATDKEKEKGSLSKSKPKGVGEK
jgi:RNA recognition motif-containing protein